MWGSEALPTPVVNMIVDRSSGAWEVAVSLSGGLETTATGGAAMPLPRVGDGGATPVADLCLLGRQPP